MLVVCDIRVCAQQVRKCASCVVRVPRCSLRVRAKQGRATGQAMCVAPLTNKQDLTSCT